MKKITLRLIASLLLLSCLLSLCLTSCGTYRSPTMPADGNISPLGGAPTSINVVNDDGTPVKDAYAITATVIEIAEDRSWFACKYEGYRVVVKDQLKDDDGYTKNCKVDITYHLSDLSIKDGAYVINRAIYICLK